eukprot:scaffold5850_cov123-Isochrysis_galbana.AAC.1
MRSLPSTPRPQSGMASETKYRRPRLGRRRFPLHRHLPHATGHTVGECLVGRHVPGVAVDRCAVFGVGRAGSVWLPGFCVVD